MATRYVSNSTANGWASGADSGPGTSTTAPWLTLEYAVANMTAGDTVILNDGIYTAATYFTINKYGTFQPLNSRAVTLRANGAQANVIDIAAAGANTLTFGAFIVDGQGTSNYGVQCTGTGSATYTMSGTWFKDCINDGFYQYLAKTITNFVGVKATGAMAYSGIRCMNHTDPAARVTIDGYEFDLSAQSQANGGAVYLQANAAGPVCSIKNCSGNMASTAAGAVIQVRNYRCLIEGDGVRRISRSGSGTGSLVWVRPYNYVKAPNPVIRRIVGDHNGSGVSGYLIVVGEDAAAEDINNCADDPIITECNVNGHGVASMHGIMVAWQRPGSVTRNRVRGCRYSLMQKGCHTQLVKSCTATGVTLTCAGASGPNFTKLKIGSRVAGTGITTAGTTVTAIASATSLTLSDAATSSNATLEFSDPDAPAGLWYDNDLEAGVTNSSGGHFYNKGSSNAVFAINRIKVASGFVANAFYIGKDDAAPDGMIATRTYCVGNTIYAPVPVSLMAVVGSVSDTSPATFALNNYRLDGGVTGTPWNYGGTTYATTALWGAANELSYRNAVPTATDMKFWKTTYHDARPAFQLPMLGVLTSFL